MTKKSHFLTAFEKGRFDGLADGAIACYKACPERSRMDSLYKQILPRTPSRQIRSFPTYQLGPCNLRNLWLINNLRDCKVLYISRDSSTDVERSLQISPFLTNKANFQKSQMNVIDLLTRDYGKIDTWSGGKNKANSNPIQTQFKANTNPIQSQFKPNLLPSVVFSQRLNLVARRIIV
jgi:hypothetical protein